MRVRIMTALPLFLAACATGPAPVPVGQVDVNGAHYRIDALASGAWRASNIDRTVTCLHPTEVACAQSIRNAVNAEVASDDMG